MSRNDSSDSAASLFRSCVKRRFFITEHIAHLMHLLLLLLRLLTFWNLASSATHRLPYMGGYPARATRLMTLGVISGLNPSIFFARSGFSCLICSMCGLIPCMMP